MLIIRDIFYCKPGKVRPMVEKFHAMSKLGERMGMGRMRIMTDVAAEKYWTVVAEMEVPSLKEFEEMMGMQGTEEDMKQFEEVMKGYHDLIDHGRREIFKLETASDKKPDVARAQPAEEKGRGYSAGKGSASPTRNLSRGKAKASRAK